MIHDVYAGLGEFGGNNCDQSYGIIGRIIRNVQSGMYCLSNHLKLAQQLRYMFGRFKATFNRCKQTISIIRNVQSEMYSLECTIKSTEACTLLCQYVMYALEHIRKPILCWPLCWWLIWPIQNNAENFFFKWLKHWNMGTHQRVLSKNTNMTRFRWFSKIFASLCFGQE